MNKLLVFIFIVALILIFGKNITGKEGFYYYYPTVPCFYSMFGNLVCYPHSYTYPFYGPRTYPYLYPY